MNDDALRAVWSSSQPVPEETLMTAIQAVLNEDRTAQEKERWLRRTAIGTLGLLCPALLWFAAFGTAPLVRGGYALMAVGTAIMIFAEWMHRTWARLALPGPSNTRSQLQKTAGLLSRQATQLRSAALWSAPIFVGGALIGAWVYQERSQAGGVVLSTGIAAAWVCLSIVNVKKARQLDNRRARMEQLLNDLE
jgi:hypothetical protein